MWLKTLYFWKIKFDPRRNIKAEGFNNSFWWKKTVCPDSLIAYQRALWSLKWICILKIKGLWDDFEARKQDILELMQPRSSD